MGLQKQVVNALFKSPKLLDDMVGIIKIARALKSMISKKNWTATPYHNVVLSIIGLKKMSVSILAH